MTNMTPKKNIAGRLARNLVATLAVTAIFAFKAMPGVHAPDPDLIAVAAR